MNKELEDFSYKIWNEEARKQIENELNFMSKEKIELPKGLDYLEIYSETHKTNEQIIEQKDKEIERLNNIINRARRTLGNYKCYSTPTEEQNKENEDISEEAYEILHENLYNNEENPKECITCGHKDIEENMYETQDGCYCDACKD